MSSIAERSRDEAGAAGEGRPRGRLSGWFAIDGRVRAYWPFTAPAVVVVCAVITFPWAFTLWMSLNEWRVGSARSLFRNAVFDNFHD